MLCLIIVKVFDSCLVETNLYTRLVSWNTKDYRSGVSILFLEVMEGAEGNEYELLILNLQSK